MNIQSNWVTATAPTDHAVPIERIDAAAARAGYKPSELTIVATGTFESQDGRTMFRIAGWPTAYGVTNAPDPPTGERPIKARVRTEGGVAKMEVLDGL